MDRPAPRGDEDSVKPLIAGRQIRIALQKHLGGGNNPALLLRADGGSGGRGFASPFDLDEGDGSTASDDQVDLTLRATKARLKQPKALQPEHQQGKPLGAPTRLLGPASVCHCASLMATARS